MTQTDASNALVRLGSPAGMLMVRDSNACPRQLLRLQPEALAHMWARAESSLDLEAKPRLPIISFLP